MAAGKAVLASRVAESVAPAKAAAFRNGRVRIGDSSQNQGLSHNAIVECIHRKLTLASSLT
jgi:hypothetical protein